MFPELERRTTLTTIVGAVVLILFLYHGRPRHFLSLFAGAIAHLPKDQAALLSYAYTHAMSFVLLFAIPALLVVVVFVFKDKLSDYGINWRGSGRETGIAFLLYLAFLPLLIWISHSAPFQAAYPKLAMIENRAGLFCAYEVLYLLKWFSWEFFFRGFLLFSFAKKFGEHAVLFSTLPFVIVHFGKPEAEIFGAIFAGFLLCRLSLTGRSIFPGVLLHFLVAGTMDFLGSTWWR